MANLITSCRILLSLLLLFFPALSPGICGLYLAAGLSNMLDGFAAIQEGHFIRTGRDIA